jgi:hypothetical protein
LSKQPCNGSRITLVTGTHGNKTTRGNGNARKGSFKKRTKSFGSKLPLHKNKHQLILGERNTLTVTQHFTSATFPTANSKSNNKTFIAATQKQ